MKDVPQPHSKEINAIFSLLYLLTFLFSWSMASQSEQAIRSLRRLMVERQLRARGISDSRVLRAMESVPRHEFIPMENREFSYDDSPVPIGSGQTISQPYIVGFMAEMAKLLPTDKVLEIGTGCGYSAAILSHLCDAVYTVETIPSLATLAQQNLKNYVNIYSFTSDGSVGLPDHAPFDAIVVTAGAPSVPSSLKEQLATNGRLIIPVYNKHLRHDELLRVTKKSHDDFDVEHLLDVGFVPLVGEEGWKHR